MPLSQKQASSPRMGQGHSQKAPQQKEWQRQDYWILLESRPGFQTLWQLSAIFIALTYTPLASAEDFTDKFVGVSDGDTITVIHHAGGEPSGSQDSPTSASSSDPTA